MDLAFSPIQIGYNAPLAGATVLIIFVGTFAAYYGLWLASFLYVQLQVLLSYSKRKNKRRKTSYYE